MSVNKDLPHIFVLPEDDANRQLAKGFHLEVHWSRQRQMQVLEEAGGWIEVLDQFESDHVDRMDLYTNRFMVLLIDFDGREDRLENARDRIPERMRDRVFILGVLTEPEALKRLLGPYEAIGGALARDCREETDATWGHELLRHNAGEAGRLNNHVRPILFGGN